MYLAQASVKISKNRLLSLLPKEEYARLLSNLQPIHLRKGEVLYHPGDVVRYCYFPLSGMISLLSTTEDYKTVEVSAVGNEGLVGVPAILQMSVTPYEVMVQIEANAMRIRADALKAQFNGGGKLHHLLLRYTHALLCQIAQSAVCNRFHTVEQRICRRLLISRDCVQSDVFPLTQESISHMLGTPRTNVSMTAHSLQEQGAIRYKRGIITIAERKVLEETACSCYRIVKNQTDGVYQ